MHLDSRRGIPGGATLSFSRQTMTASAAASRRRAESISVLVSDSAIGHSQTNERALWGSGQIQ